MRPYSVDLRERVVAAVAVGQSRRAVARLCGLGPATVVRWAGRQLWAEFRRANTFERRFFNVDAMELLDRIFDKVHLLSDDKGRPAFCQLDDDQIVYCARRVRSLEEAAEIGASPETTLAPTPEALRRAGRMNAGVGAFYAALDPSGRRSAPTAAMWFFSAMPHTWSVRRSQRRARPFSHISVSMCRACVRGRVGRWDFPTCPVPFCVRLIAGTDYAFHAEDLPTEHGPDF